jgi:pyridoxal phosphate enzyme (YggS family)
MSGSVSVAENLREVRDRIGEAAIRAARDPDSVCLVAVTKTLPVAAVVEAYDAGQRHFGENRPEEGAEKIPQVYRRVSPKGPANAQLSAGKTSQVGSSPIWHMIGHVQSRKADLVVAHFDAVHSIDRLRIAQRISACAVAAAREIPVLLECNVSGEASKFGYRAAGWEQDAGLRTALGADVAAVAALPGLRIEGLMTMAPLSADLSVARAAFASLRALRDDLQGQFPSMDLHHLSMGMTNDYEVAIEEGATLVRIGRAIFGSRR